MPAASPIEPNHERQLEFARIWHRVFSSNLVYVVENIQEEGDVDPVVIGDESACLLGKWLANQAANVRAMPAFEKLLKVHQQYHEVAACLAKAYLAKDEGAVTSLLDGDFLHLSEAVMADVDALSHELAQAGIFVQRFNVVPKRTRATIWDASLEVGVPHIDQRHQAIAALIDELAASDDLVCSPSEDIHFLDALATMIQNDVRLEQEFLAQSGRDLAKYADHMADHQKILDYVDALLTKIKAGEPLPLAEVGQFLGKWFVEHLITHDMDL